MNTKAVRLYGKNDLRLEEFTLPEVGPDDVQVKIICDSVCMSTYKAALEGEDHKRVPNDCAVNPTIVGHEFCGDIVAVGENWAHKYKVGDKFSIQPAHFHNGSQIFIGYLIYDIGVMALGGQEVLDSILLVNGVFSIIVGALLGIIPGCGVQVIFISLYSKGVIPFAALVANSISQDGDALFPLIAMDKKSALWATILTTIPAIVIGFIVYIVMH